MRTLWQHVFGKECREVVRQQLVSGGPVGPAGELWQKPMQIGLGIHTQELACFQDRIEHGVAPTRIGVAQGDPVFSSQFRMSEQALKGSFEPGGVFECEERLLQALKDRLGVKVAIVPPLLVGGVPRVSRRPYIDQRVRSENGKWPGHYAIRAECWMWSRAADLSVAAKPASRSSRWTGRRRGGSVPSGARAVHCAAVVEVVHRGSLAARDYRQALMLTWSREARGAVHALAGERAFLAASTLALLKEHSKINRVRDEYENLPHPRVGVLWQLPQSVASHPRLGASLGASGPALLKKYIEISCLGSKCEGYTAHQFYLNISVL